MNMKKIIACVIACCIVGGVMPNVADIASNTVITASAVDDYTEGTYEQLTYKKYSDYVEISKCDKSATEVEIPAEIEGVPVTVIGSMAFNGCTGLTLIEIPNSVTSIWDWAFKDCTGLTSVTIPDSVTTIWNEAFAGCTGLTSVTIPDSVTSIGVNVFKDTLWLEERRKENPLVIVNNILIDGQTCSGDVVIPDGVTNIGQHAFKSTGLTSVTIPDSVTSIGIYAFSGCTGLTSAKIPDSVTSIGVSAFSECTGLESITILNPECKISDSSMTITNSSQLIPGENGGKGTRVYIFDGTIYGYENSTAQAYAEKYNRKFEPLGKAPETTSTSPVVATTTKPTTTTTKPTTTTGGSDIKVTLLGDTNEDGSVDIADATAIVQHMGNPDEYGLTEQGKINADIVNKGDGVTGADAVVLQLLEAKKIKQSEFPITMEQYNELLSE